MATTEVLDSRKKVESAFIAHALLSVKIATPDADPLALSFVAMPDITTVVDAMSTYKETRGWKQYFEGSDRWTARFPWKEREMRRLIRLVLPSGGEETIKVLSAIEQLPIHQQIRRLVAPTFGERLLDYGRLAKETFMGFIRRPAPVY